MEEGDSEHTNEIIVLGDHKVRTLGANAKGAAALN